MNVAKIQDALAVYRRYLSREGVSAKEFPHERLGPSRGEALSHCAGMIPQMEGFLTDNRMGKTYRWLGFIQGVLWVLGVFSLDALKNHNRPT